MLSVTVTSTFTTQSYCFRADLFANFCTKFLPTPGRDQGHSTIQMAQPEFSAKYGMHLSKSTHQRSTPRTICLSGSMAMGGHASSQMRHLEQNSSIPNSRFSVLAKGAFGRTAGNRKEDPNSGLIKDPCLPNSSKPHSNAGGTITSFPAIGRISASESHPCVISRT